MPKLSEASLVADRFKDVRPLGISRRQALDFFSGPTLYAVRLNDGRIKIGHTANMGQRFGSFKRCTVLGFKPGTRDDEAAIHASLKAHRATGREYYHEHSDVLDVINPWRRDLGLPDI